MFFVFPRSFVFVFLLEPEVKRKRKRDEKEEANEPGVNPRSRFSSPFLRQRRNFRRNETGATRRAYNFSKLCERATANICLVIVSLSPYYISFRRIIIHRAFSRSDRSPSGRFSSKKRKATNSFTTRPTRSISLSLHFVFLFFFLFFSISNARMQEHRRYVSKAEICFQREYYQFPSRKPFGKYLQIFDGSRIP